MKVDGRGRKVEYIVLITAQHLSQTGNQASLISISVNDEQWSKLLIVLLARLMRPLTAELLWRRLSHKNLKTLENKSAPN